MVVVSSMLVYGHQTGPLLTKAFKMPVEDVEAQRYLWMANIMAMSLLRYNDHTRPIPG